ncbi:peptidase domain-containing ABC transporter [Paracoccus sp. (in: a-proteobacteria)]|uniref:peptidase domain-containing ABC transporter n=1 Tax=Paracoccus sp. TaxID=267 RepID=UPI0026DEB6E5|nr:peptidase domain-containing ABC transporter [Paracoccus sp. (in: a-proteobacteria)]MDO5368908.1 peptidase domain-containing ABC transporter [Paracoccus sp. (in: a-proteobacteria)]
MSADLVRRISGGFPSRTPAILQVEAAECGAACLAMIAGHHRHVIDLAALRQRHPASIKGATMRDLVGLGARLDLATRAVRLELEDLSRLRLPAVLHWGHNHFVVLVRVQRRHVIIHDPAIGRRRLPMAEVSRQFTGVALEAWPTESFRPRVERARIRVLDLLRRTSGLGGAAAQILAISLALEVAVIALPIGFALILDEVVVAADVDLLTIIALALGLLLALQVAAGFARAWATMLLGTSLTLQWKVSLFDQMMRLPLSFFTKRHIGDVVSRFGSIDAMQRTLTTRAIQSIIDGIMSVTLVVMMWLYGGWLIWIALASLAAYIALRLASYRAYRAMSEEAILHAAQETTHFMESVRGIASVKAMNIEGRRRGTWINHLIDRVNAELRVQKLDAAFAAAGTGLFGFDRILVMALGARAILAGDLTVGTLVAFLAYKDQFATRVNALVDTALQFLMMSLHGERIADIALAETEEPDPPAALPPRVGWKAASLELRDVSFRYAPGDPEVLSEFSLHVRAGECVGIAGPSGVGKSTLLAIVAGLARPTGGQVLIDGIPLGRTGLAAYRDRIGCVLQDDRLFAGSIADNIAAFDPEAGRDAVVAAARMAAIHDEIEAFPMGYETLVGDMGSALSGGQRQRLFLARALCRRPGILILDEATSHLDEENERAINAAVRRLDITRIVVAHRPSTLAATDRVVSLGEVRGEALATAAE